MNYYEYYSKYDNMPNGEVKRDAIKKFIELEEEEHNYSTVLALYHDYFEEDVFHCSCYRLMIEFPRYLALFEKHPELQSEYVHQLMWVFKWLIGEAKNFYEMPVEKLESLYEKYAEYCKRSGYNLRTYYDSVIAYIIYSFDDKRRFCGMTADEAYKKMLKTRRDSFSNCEACEASNRAEYLLLYENDEQKALGAIGRILSGRMRCAEIPHVTYAVFALWYYMNSRPRDAKKYAMKSYRLLDRDYGGDSSLLRYKSMCALVVADSESEAALKMMKSMAPYIYNNPNGSDCFWFYKAFYNTLCALERDGIEQARIRLPIRNEDIYNENNLYNVSTLKEYMQSKASFYADKFDSRNKSGLYKIYLDI